MRYTRACLASLFGSLPPGWQAGRDFEVIVYDDCSTDATPALLGEYAGRVRTITGDGLGSYATSNNRMGELASGRWLCLLNNDTLLAPGWLEPMLAMGERYREAGVIGNIHVFPGGRVVNHAGVVFDDRRIPRNLFDGLTLDTPGVCLDRTLQAAMAACWLVETGFYKELGGFDERYCNGLEDMDFCLRTRQRGRTVRVCGSSVIAHHGGSTPGRYVLDGVNEKRFLEQWADQVEPDWLEAARRESVAWPARSRAYKTTRAVWRNPLVKSSLRAVMRTRAGARLRQQVLRQLISTTKRR